MGALSRRAFPGFVLSLNLHLGLTEADLGELLAAADARLGERERGGGKGMSWEEAAALIKRVLGRRYGTFSAYLIATQG